MIVCPNDVHFNELKVSDALEEFSFYHFMIFVF